MGTLPEVSEEIEPLGEPGRRGSSSGFVVTERGVLRSNAEPAVFLRLLGGIVIPAGGGGVS